MRLFILFAVSLFCLTCLVACQNNAPADQLTVVQGTVTSVDTGRPLRGVSMGIEGYSNGFSGRLWSSTPDTVSTNAQGKYQLRFYNKKGLYYSVCLNPYVPSLSSSFPRFAVAPGNGTGRGGNQRDLTLGRSNTVDFQALELGTVAVRIRNRNTGYQQLYLDYRNLRGDKLDTTAYLRGYYHFPSTSLTFSYRKISPTGAFLKDTSVAAVILNPTARPPDTLRATLTFVR